MALEIPFRYPNYSEDNLCETKKTKKKKTATTELDYLPRVISAKKYYKTKYAPVTNIK